MSCMIPVLMEMSSIDVGSSATTNDGFITSARAIATRCL